MAVRSERSTVGSTTTETVYAFSLEEYSYDSSGNLTSSTHYYSLAGHLIGEAQTSGSSTTTNFFMTDALDSVLAVISNTESSAALLSNQVFAPYGTPLSQNGASMGQYTNKGFTGQYNDPTSGLDYYVSRYYDSVAGVFFSADKTLGNATGMNPYNYVGNNPETNNDPTGQMYYDPGGGGGGGGNNNNNNNNNNNGGGGCGWWNPSCAISHIWHTVVNGAQTVEHHVETDVNNGVHFLQQQEQELIQDGIKLGIKIIVALVAAAIAVGAFLYGLISSGSSGGAWTENQQRQIAFRFGNEVDQHRINGNHDQHGPYAKGCIGVGGDTSCSNSSVRCLELGKIAILTILSPKYIPGLWGKFGIIIRNCRKAQLSMY
jgi:RHS repeat-associated protein